jgi:putative tryptophan/tyrosine transport system substrate-binding protein
MPDVKRRDFITLLGGAAAAWPLAASAQQRAMPVIGFLRSTSRLGAEHLVTAFRQGLAETGYVEDRSVAIEYRWADGNVAHLPELAADLVRRQVAVIVTNGVAVKPAMAATSTIPIVFVIGVDPVRSGLVASLNRPGANVTGTSIVSIDLDAKRLEILRELVPQAAVIAILLDPNVVETDISTQSVEVAARAIGRRVVIMKAASEHEFDAAFSIMVQSDAGALLVGGGAFFVTQRRRIVDLAARHALPSIYMTRDSVEAGGLMSYGPSQIDAYRRAGVYVGRVLEGAKPAELPVELPTRYELVINLKTAKALGLEVPPTLIALADEVIE